MFAVVSQIFLGEAPANEPPERMEEYVRMASEQATKHKEISETL